MSDESIDQPVIGSDQYLPEITFKAAIVSIFLIIILAASNAYLGLKTGTTIAASIPAVVISMGIFRWFCHSTILETNTVQTAAAVGEGITAGVIFTIPALVIMHFWNGFHYWPMVGIAITGGMLGILFSIPVRNALLRDRSLRFPEGVAIGQVMKASVQGGTSLKSIIMGGVVGGLIGLFQTGFQIISDTYDYWIIKDKLVFGFSMGFSPAILAAGYICGVEVGISILVGVLLGWVFGIPLISAYYGVASHIAATDVAQDIWSNYIRYIGVGTMLLGGLWTLLMLVKPVAVAIKASFDALQRARKGDANKVVRTDYDMPVNFVFWGICLLALIIVFQLVGVFGSNLLALRPALYWIIVGLCVVYIVIAGFVFGSIAAYFAGLVGATNTPGSGLLMAALLLLSVILLLFLNPILHFSVQLNQASLAAALVVSVCSFIGIAVIMTGEATQVYKAGQIIGATPWKQQVVLLGSVVVSALVIPLVLVLLFNAYGIGGVFPHPGMLHSEMLSAPQAGLVAAVAQGVFSHQLPWNMIFIGVLVAGVGIVVDEVLKRLFSLRLPVLAVGLGIYLPMSASMPVVIGGLFSYAVFFFLKKTYLIFTDD